MRPKAVVWHRASDPLVEAAEPWYLFPLFGAGSLTVLIGEAKYAGKSTLVLNLLGQMLRGAPVLGRSATWAPVVYYTEQPPVSFRQTLFQAGALGEAELHFLHRHEMARYDWDQVVEQLGDKCEAEAAKYLVVDTFSGCVGLRGEEENSAGGLIKEKIEKLQDLCAEQQIAVLVTHHMRKQKADEGSVNIVNASRGHSALSDTADVLAALKNSSNNIRCPKRSLEVIGRFADLPVEPLQLSMVEGVYQDVGMLRLHDAADRLLSALPDAFPADLFNAVADALELNRDVCWAALRHLQREGQLSGTAELYQKTY